jgi:hypothetical protein
MKLDQDKLQYDNNRVTVKRKTHAELIRDADKIYLLLYTLNKIQE